MKTNFLALAVCSVLFFSCSKEEEDNAVAQNQAPASFSITVDRRDNTIIIGKTTQVLYDIRWTEAIDPEKDAVTYDIEIVGGLTLAVNLTTPRERTIEPAHLNPNKTLTQTVKITAKDSKGAKTVVTKEFAMGITQPQHARQ